MKTPGTATSSVPLSAQMLTLLEDVAVTKRISLIFPDFKAIFAQLALDITNETNRDTVGPTHLAMKHIYDTLFLFATKGAAVIEKERQTKK